MIILAIVVMLAAITAMCWFLYTIATFALPALVGASAIIWAYHTDAGLAGAVAVGVAAATSTVVIGRLLLALLKPLWLLVALAFIAPAAIAGFHATHGIVKHLMPADSWQLAVSILGAAAIGATAFMRIATMAVSEQAGQRTSRA